jgi:hypothetical protein
LKKMKFNKISFAASCFTLFFLNTAIAFAQTTSFTYQGRLLDGGTPANGVYEIQFTLWDATAGGTQLPQPAPVTITRTNVPVSAGSFTVQPLDLGAVAFPGADRFLEISVRRNALDPFTTLSPRQQITATPYAIRSLTAATADTASNATQLGGIDAGRFVQADAGGNVNIAGGLTVGGSFSLDTVNAQRQYNLRGMRILSDGGGPVFLPECTQDATTHQVFPIRSSALRLDEPIQLETPIRFLAASLGPLIQLA